MQKKVGTEILLEVTTEVMKEVSREVLLETCPPCNNVEISQEKYSLMQDQIDEAIQSLMEEVKLRKALLERRSERKLRKKLKREERRITKV